MVTEPRNEKIQAILDSMKPKLTKARDFIPESYEKNRDFLKAVNAFHRTRHHYPVEGRDRHGMPLTYNKYSSQNIVDGVYDPDMREKLGKAYNAIEAVVALQSAYLHQEYADKDTVEIKPENYDPKRHTATQDSDGIKNPRVIMDMLVNNSSLAYYKITHHGVEKTNVAMKIDKENLLAIEQLESILLAVKEKYPGSDTLTATVDEELDAYRKSGLQSATKAIRELYFPANPLPPLPA